MWDKLVIALIELIVNRRKDETVEGEPRWVRSVELAREQKRIERIAAGGGPYPGT